MPRTADAEPQTAEAVMVPGMRVFGIRSLAQVVALLRNDPEVPDAPCAERPPRTGDGVVRGQSGGLVEQQDAFNQKTPRTEAFHP